MAIGGVGVGVEVGASRRVGILQRVANSNALANKIIAVIFLDIGYLAGDLQVYPINLPNLLFHYIIGSASRRKFKYDLA
jgi:hypothetical protein